MPDYPYKSGDVLVLGPGFFVDEEKGIVNWRGVNYYAAVFWEPSDDDYNDHEPLE